MLQNCTCAVLILQMFERSFTIASRHVCECRSVTTTGSDENCRQRKKEGGLCGCEWIICPVNVTELHMRGPDFASVRALLHHHQPPSSGQYCSLRRGGSFLSRFLATGRMSPKFAQNNSYQIFSITASLHRKTRSCN